MYVQYILPSTLLAFSSTKYLGWFCFSDRSLITEELSLGFGSTLGFFTRAATDLPSHELSILSLALLETSGFINHQQLMLLLDFYFRNVKQHEYIKDHYLYPWYVIVHHEALAAWWQWLSEKHHYLIWKINSHSIQMIVVLRQSEHKLNNWTFLLSLQA